MHIPASHSRWLLLLGWLLLSGLPVSADPSAAGAAAPGDYRRVVTLGEGCLAAGRWSEAVAIFQRVARAGPAGYEVEEGLGRALLGARRYGEAVAPLEAAVLLRPDLPPPRLLLGRAYSRQGEYGRAEDPLLGAYNLDPSYEPAWGELAGLYLATARAALAEPFLALLVARHPRNTVLLGKQLSAARALGQGDLVRATLWQLIAALPPAQTPAFRRELALELLSPGLPAADYVSPRELPQAEAQARAAVRLEPRNPDNAAVLGQVLLVEGKTAEAADVLRGLPAEGIRQPEVFLGLARAELAAGQPEAALADARRALALAPNSEAAARVAQTGAARVRHPQEALQYTRRLVALHPTNAPQRLALSASLEQTGQPAEALVQCELAAGEKSGGLPALRALAEQAAALGNPEYQLTVARHLASAAPRTETAPLVDLLLAQRRWDEAGVRLDAWGWFTPGDPELLARETRLLRESGRPEEAGRVLAEALRRNPQSPALHLERALLAAQQGAPAAAERLRVLIRGSADGSAESAAALPVLARLYAAGGGAVAAATEISAVADAQPERTDLALAAAGQCDRAGLEARAGMYYERAGRAPGEGGALGRAAAAYDRAGDTGGLLRVAASYLLQEAHDAEGLALVAELQAVPQAPPAPVRAALVGLVQAEPGSVDYHRQWIALFTACDRREPLEAILAARAVVTHSPADRVALALEQQRHDPEGALRTLSALSPAEAAPPAVALVRAQLLRETDRPAAALAALETAVGGEDAEVALERGDLLTQAQRPEEALAEYMRALQAGAYPAATLERVAELWMGKQVSLAAVLAGLDAVCARVADPAPLRQWVQERLPRGDPAVQAWLEFHAG
jgi:tetratricopeptide (TPR) repeat protein